MRIIVKIGLVLLITLTFYGVAVGVDLVQVSKFGDNPGNLNMYKYAPRKMPKKAPLVVVLHGCFQSAQLYNYMTGWSDLADRFKFYVLYPEQRDTNNMNKCFNWFLAGDYSRGQGEAESIIQMVNKMKKS